MEHKGLDTAHECDAKKLSRQYCVTEHNATKGLFIDKVIQSSTYDLVHLSLAFLVCDSKV